jgi:general secretion pathway protein L
MSETLVIRLDARHPGLAQWVVVDGTGACVLAPSAGPLGGAAALAAGRRLVVLVPASRVLRVRTDVPVRGAARIAQALPFALEDLLADDVEELHFASGARATDGQVSVAVVRRDHMQEWLTTLAAAGLDPQGLFADSDGVADIPGMSTLLLEDTQIVLRDPGGDPVVAETEGLDGLLELWLAQPALPNAEGVTPARNLQVYDATLEGWPNATWERLSPLVDSLEVRRLPDGALARLAGAAVTATGVNLLQGDYGRRSPMRSYWPRWRVPAGLAATAAVLALAVAGAEAWQLGRQSAALETDLAAAASYTFPGAADAGDLRGLLDLRQREAGATASAAGTQFLDTLRIVAKAIAASGDARLENLSYRTGVMELKIRAPSADVLDRISRTVSEGGRLKAEIQSANAEGDQIAGRIRISPGGA